MTYLIYKQGIMTLYDARKMLMHHIGTPNPEVTDDPHGDPAGADPYSAQGIN